jgi:uncharacterized membrane protein (DUF485 family)
VRPRETPWFAVTLLEERSDMGGFDHSGHTAEQQHEDQLTITRNARYGMVLFVAYLVLYGGFVAVNAFNSDVMDTIIWQGVNLAILYGFGLILAAIALAMVYGWLCRKGVTNGDDRSSSSSG